MRALPWICLLKIGQESGVAGAQTGANGEKIQKFAFEFVRPLVRPRRRHFRAKTSDACAPTAHRTDQIVRTRIPRARPPQRTRAQSKSGARPGLTEQFSATVRRRAAAKSYLRFYSNLNY